MIAPAMAAEIPPENCCSEALMALKAPRLVTSGTAESKAWAGTMREKMPRYIRTLITITAASEVRPRWVQIATITMASTLPKQKVLNLPKLSLALPTQGPM